MHSENSAPSSHPLDYNFKEDSTFSVLDILLLNNPHFTQDLELKMANVVMWSKVAVLFQLNLTKPSHGPLQCTSREGEL